MGVDRPLLVVSLTSWPPRIHFLHHVLESIFSQDMKADVVVLQLAEEEFPDRKLPQDVMRFVDKGLQIRWNEYNERPFKKLMPTIKEWPDAMIVTIDDDMIYPHDFLSKLVGDFLREGCKRPLTCAHIGWEAWGNIATHWGTFSITMAKFHEPYLSELYYGYVKDMVIKGETLFDDQFYTMTALCNHIYYGYGGDDLRGIRKSYRAKGKIGSIQKISGLHSQDAQARFNSWVQHKILELYGIDVEQIAKQKDRLE